ncbi:ParA family protein [Pseudomonas sp. QC2]|uniref:ParA family protein n=1 Tax=Pseudomonas sp. QC2 TaxID=2065822 RepID=UPI0011AECDEA|nr:DnaB-like helicase C-terminal domain-containing protein [Pseudomonas sp. QC2]
MTVAAVVSTKGGPGKTTVGANLGAFCADAGIRILPIDLDNQPSLSSFYALSHEALERIDYHFNEDESITGIPSGLEAMRQITGGFQDADLIVIAARPSMGKTSLTFSVVDAAPQQKPTNTVQIYRHVDGRQTASSTDQSGSDRSAYPTRLP